MATQVSPSPKSSLNPNAALFIPSSPHLMMPSHDTHDDDDDGGGGGKGDTYDATFPIMPEWDVEDFSPEWWALVQTSPEFCEFWLHGYEASDADDLLRFIQQHEDLGFTEDASDRHAPIE